MLILLHQTTQQFFAEDNIRDQVIRLVRESHETSALSSSNNSKKNLMLVGVARIELQRTLQLEGRLFDCYARVGVLHDVFFRHER